MYFRQFRQLENMSNTFYPLVAFCFDTKHKIYEKLFLHDSFYLLRGYNLEKPIYTLVVTGAISLVDTNM